MCRRPRLRPSPPHLPPGALLSIGSNGATTDEGFLDGDGMVHCVIIPEDREKDHVTYSSTYLETKGRSLERRRGDGSRFGGTLGAAPRGVPMLGNLARNGLTFGTADMQKDTCNTAMAISGDRLLALMEQSPPTEFRVSRAGRVETIHAPRADQCWQHGRARTDRPEHRRARGGD